MNYIILGSIFTTEGPKFEIRTNSLSTLETAIQQSPVLNADNTTLWAENTYTTLVPQDVVYEEINNFLSRNLGEGNYTVTNLEFNWSN